MPTNQLSFCHCCVGFRPSDVGRVPSAASELQNVFRSAMRAALPKLTDEPVVVQTNNPKFGDYQLNNAMRIFAHLKGQACTLAWRHETMGSIARLSCALRMVAFGSR